MSLPVSSLTVIVAIEVSLVPMSSLFVVFIAMSVRSMVVSMSMFSVSVVSMTSVLLRIARASRLVRLQFLLEILQAHLQ